MKFLKDSLHKFTIRRSEDGSDSKSAYECVYKIDVHREHDIINDGSYAENIPPCMAADGGILLIVLLQWDEVFQGLGRFIPKPLSRAFYVSEKQQAGVMNKNNKEDALRDVISSTIFRMGITSSEENESVSGVLVSSVISMYDKCKDINDHRYPSGWTPVVLDIVPERQVSTEEMGWANREADRFCLRYMSTRKKSSAAADGDHAAEIEGEDCCSICLKEGKGESEFVKLPSCSHSYHKDCIIQWLTRTGQNRDHKDCISGWQRLTKTKNCPLCRTPVPLTTSLADECPWQRKPGSWMRRFLK